MPRTPPPAVMARSGWPSNVLHWTQNHLVGNEPPQFWDGESAERGGKPLTAGEAPGRTTGHQSRGRPSGREDEGSKAIVTTHLLGVGGRVYKVVPLPSPLDEARGRSEGHKDLITEGASEGASWKPNETKPNEKNTYAGASSARRRPSNARDRTQETEGRGPWLRGTPPLYLPVWLKDGEGGQPSRGRLLRARHVAPSHPGLHGVSPPHLRRQEGRIQERRGAAAA